jgi:hypothetical protein
MGVAEKFTLGKNGDHEGGEDHIEVTPHFYGVFDGVTSRGRAVTEGLRLEGMTPGRWAARTLGNALHSLDRNADVASALEHFRAALYDGMLAQGADPEAWDWPAAAQTCVFSIARREIWRLGDISIAVNGRTLPETPTPLDAPATAYRAAALWALLAAGADVEELRADDPTWGMLLPLLELQHHLRNCPDPQNPFAYWIPDGRPLPAHAMQVHSVNHGDEVVITTDGYPRPANTLAQAEEELGRILDEDPLLIRLHHGFRPVATTASSFDDRAYLRFTV